MHMISPAKNVLTYCPNLIVLSLHIISQLPLEHRPRHKLEPNLLPVLQCLVQSPNEQDVTEIFPGGVDAQDLMIPFLDVVPSLGSGVDDCWLQLTTPLWAKDASRGW